MSFTSNTPAEASQRNVTISPCQIFTHRLYYLIITHCCVSLIILPYVSLLPDIAQKVICIAATLAIVCSAFLMNYFRPSEPSHILVHFVFYLMAASSVVYTFVPFGQWLENKTNPTAGTTFKTIAWSTGVVASTLLLDLLFYALFNFGSRDLGWYGSFRERFYLASSELVKRTGRRTGRGAGDLLVSIGTWIRDEEPISNSASNEPLLDEVEMKDKTSLPPPYSHDMDVTYVGHRYRKIETV